MTIHFRQGKLEAQERQAILEEVYQQAKAGARAAVKVVIEALLQAEVSAKLGREKGAVRHISAQAREVDWVCGHCGCGDAQHFTRDGHYRRSLQTGWGSIQALRVPMLQCQQCGHDVICHFTILEKYERFWLDLDQRDFEHTIAFYQLTGIARELLRTTSLLERTNRELRRKFRQACCFSSRRGAEVAIYLQVQRLHARWRKSSWPQMARLLALACY